MTGWPLRPGTAEDLPALVALLRAVELHYDGQSGVELERKRELLAADPAFAFAEDQVLVDGPQGLIASVTLSPRSALIYIHPEHEAPELRAELLAWAERRLTQLDRTLRVGVSATQTVALDSFRAAGYTLERFYTEMVREFATTGPPQTPRIPDGYRIRRLDPVADLVALHRLDARAFSPAGDYFEQTVEEYRDFHLGPGHLAPAWSFVIESDSGELAGSLIGTRPRARPHGHVSLLAVDPDHQRRGIARALLLSAFGVAHSEGYATAELEVASDNPRALDLYTGVGMSPGQRFENWTRGG